MQKDVSEKTKRSGGYVIMARLIVLFFVVAIVSVFVFGIALLSCGGGR